MKTVTIGRTAYKINDDRDIFAEHAKCTGKPRPQRPLTPETIHMKTKDNLHPLMREIIAPWAPLTYADHYYVDLGYRFERGQVSEHEYKMALAEGPEARRLMGRGAMEAMRSAY